MEKLNQKMCCSSSTSLETLFFIFVFGLAFSLPIYAIDIYNSIDAQETANRGFIKNPPKWQTDKFPMCDAFLKVTWIDKSKNIGYSQFDFYMKGRKSKKMALALISIDENFPYYDLDLNIYKGHLEETFAFIRRSKVEYPSIVPLFVGKNKPYFFLNHYRDGDFDLISDDIGNFGESLLTNENKTVCIPYPGNQRMWIVQGKLLKDINIFDNCGINEVSSRYLTTDGKNFYLDNKCLINLN